MAEKITEEVHVPVLLTEVVSCLQPESGKLYVDGTLGLGGHSQAILEKTGPDGRVIGFEWDEDAGTLATRRLQKYGLRFQWINASYADISTVLSKLRIEKIDGLLVDLGVSSLQLDIKERGFSFQKDAPLDMRMNKALPQTAADIVANSDEKELADILYHYGEERQARRIARWICEERENIPIASTRQLADLVHRAVPRRFHPQKIHVATRTFQALRIAVNRELDNLVRLLTDAPGLLNKGSRCCVITFHSLEDRIVKQAFKDSDRLRVIHKKPLEAGAEERVLNPRARSARLRCAERV